MIDIKLIRENPDIVRKDLKKRGADDKAKILEQLIGGDKKWRELIVEADKMRQRRNQLSMEIAKLKKEKKNADAQLKEAGKLAEQIKKDESEIKNLEELNRTLLMRIPNILHESVPIGKDESDNKEIKKFGKPTKFKFQAKDHIDLSMPLGLIDVERAAKISGARFYFLKNDLVKLNYVLLQYGIDFMVKRGFNIAQPPYMITRKAYEGVTDVADFEHVIYKIEGEDLHLIATSEHPLMSMFMGETFDKKQLPMKVAGVSTCFRKEAGAHGKDTKGIFRVHQFDKVEQTVVCLPEQSWKLHEELIRNSEEFFKSLGIPYRVVNVCTGDMGTVAAKKYDLEGWFPAQGKYRELGSCSNCTDYQSRRLGIKYRNKQGEAPAGFVHTLNNTLVATSRTIACILENFQQKDGSVKIPKVLWKYTGFKEIKAPKAKNKKSSKLKKSK